MRATPSQAECGPQKQYEPLLMKQPAEYNKMAKELENWTTKEQEDGEDWMKLLSNLAKGGHQGSGRKN